MSLGAVAVTTALIYPLREITPAVSNGVVYMLAVLLVSTYWGLGLGLLTALANALAFNFFHTPPTGHFTIAISANNGNRPNGALRNGATRPPGVRRQP